MTSSFILSKIEETPGRPYTSYPLPGSSLGGIEDRHIKLQGRCHPDFITVPIGRPDGVKMCVRKPLVGENNDGCSPMSRIGDPLHARAAHLKRESQGYNRGSVRMYDPQSDFPIQEWNPQYYADRRMPWEQDLIRRDYPRTMTEVKYSGTGIKALRTPAELRDEGKPYYQYQYSYTPQEDRATGMRTATDPNASLPEVKYDVTRLVQPYPVWKNEQRRMSKAQPSPDEYDNTYYTRIV